MLEDERTMLITERFGKIVADDMLEDDILTEELTSNNASF